jgi:enterochelin esterase-like enzyme
MIVVLPDSKTIHNGSMYSSSVTTGNFEKFIAHDVVSYIDTHYRTIPDRTSRGLVGHSMGGVPHNKSIRGGYPAFSQR